MTEKPKKKKKKKSKKDDATKTKPVAKKGKKPKKPKSKKDKPTKGKKKAPPTKSKKGAQLGAKMKGEGRGKFMTDRTTETGKMLTEARLKKDMTTLDVANELGLGRAQYCNIELGRSRLSVYMLVTLIKLFNLDPKKFLLALEADG